MGHSFDNLLGSDNTEFTIMGTDASGNPMKLLEFKADYIAEFDDGVSYKSAGVADKNVVLPKGKVTDKADGSKVGASDPLLAQVPNVETSLAHNFTLFGNLTVDSPAFSHPNFASWEIALLYEVQIDASVAGAGGFSSVLPTLALPTDAHASPSKIKVHLDDPRLRPVPVIPLPPAAWMGISILAGLGGINFWKKYRRTAA